MIRNALFMVLMTVINTYAIDSHILHQTTMARYSVAKKDYACAKNRYTALLKPQQHASVPVYVYHGYVRYLAAVGRHHEIVQLIPHIETSFIHDPDTLFLIAQAVAHVGNVDDAHKRIIELSTRFKDHQEIIFSAAQVYLNNKEPKNALLIIDTILNTPPRRPSDRIFSLLKSQIHVQLNENKEALATIQTCLELYPTFDKGWLFYAMLQEQKDALDLAIQGYKNFLELTDEPNKQIEQHLLRLSLQKSLHDKHRKISTTSQSLLEKAVLLFNNKEYAAGLESINKYLAQNPADTDGRIMKIQLLLSINRLDEAVQLIAQWIDESPDTPLWFQTMHMLCRMGISYEQAYNATNTIAKKHPQSLLTHLYLAEYATRMNKHTQALEHCKQALSISNDPRLTATLYFHMGLLYHQDDKLDKALEILAQGAALPYAYAPLHNLLAYCYITHAHDTHNALSHIERALALEPNNPHYEDTQALIFYEQHKYDQAGTLLEKAHKQAPKNAVILEHLAKNQYKQGNREQAYKTLEHALAITQSKTDKERITKIQHAWRSAQHDAQP